MKRTEELERGIQLAPQDLKGKDPEELYCQIRARKGARVDRCVLYVFRCAGYYASHERHEPALLKYVSEGGRKPQNGRAKRCSFYCSSTMRKSDERDSAVLYEG